MIKKFDEFNAINEGVKIDKIKEYVKTSILKGILPFVIISSITNYMSKNDAEILVKDIIEQYDDASLKYKEEIYKARLIALDKAKKFNNPKINSKIMTIPFRVGKISKEAIGEFFYKDDVCIVVDPKGASNASSEYITDVFAHELFHYIDFLIGDVKYDKNHNRDFSGSWSNINSKNIKDIINNSTIDSVEKVRDRIFIWSLGSGSTREEFVNTLDSLKKEIETTTGADSKNCHKSNKQHKQEYYKGGLSLLAELDEYATDIWKKRDYYTSNEEVYVRFQSLKMIMKRKGIISDINQDLTESNFVELVKLSRGSDHFGDLVDSGVLQLLMFIDFNKMKEMNKIAKSDTDVIDNIA